MADRVTMSDVAREAGVSLMTVSRVVNNKGEISPATRQRVLDVIDRLGYRPSGIARGLATKRTGTLGLVVPDIANPFFGDVVRGVEQTAYAEGYSVILCNSNEDPKREADVIESLEEKRVDGMILCSSRLDEEALRRALQRHQAAVMVNRRLAGQAVDTVRVDDYVGGRLATDHLLSTGHRAVGFLAGPPASQSGRQRLRAYGAALEDAAVTPNPGWVRHCAPDVAGGYQAGYELLTARPEVTALFCYNDLVAVGALQARLRLARPVPGGLAVVGYDDIPLAALVTPALTTCHVPRYELGVQAVRLLVQRIAGGAEEGEDVVLQPELVVRASAPGR
jgi:LacI family transcriptional regulator